MGNPVLEPGSTGTFDAGVGEDEPVSYAFKMDGETLKLYERDADDD